MKSAFLRARSLFRRFHGREPQAVNDIARIKMDTDVFLCVGEVDGIIYRVHDNPKGYLHRFKKSRRPLLYVSSNGTQICMIKGAYKFTERGFEG